MYPTNARLTKKLPATRPLGADLADRLHRDRSFEIPEQRLREIVPVLRWRG
jgi:hypothetical protein